MCARRVFVSIKPLPSRTLVLVVTQLREVYDPCVAPSGESIFNKSRNYVMGMTAFPARAHKRIFMDVHGSDQTSLHTLKWWHATGMARLLLEQVWWGGMPSTHFGVCVMKATSPDLGCMDSWAPGLRG